jgi:hypothetical protein
MKVVKRNVELENDLRKAGVTDSSDWGSAEGGKEALTMSGMRLSH